MNRKRLQAGKLTIAHPEANVTRKLAWSFTLKIIETSIMPVKALG